MKTLTKHIAVFLIVSLFIVGCYPDEILPVQPILGENLQIAEQVGIKLESFFVTDEASMNVKAPASGEYVVIIHHLTGRVMSKEEVLLEEGDNILKVYTGALPKEPYTISFYDRAGSKLGETIINVY